MSRHPSEQENSRCINCGEEEIEKDEEMCKVCGEAYHGKDGRLEDNE